MGAPGPWFRTGRAVRPSHGRRGHSIRTWWKCGAAVPATTPDKASPQAAGTTITFTANASGGTAPYQYKWWLKSGSTWSMVKDWSSSATYAWTPGTANSYVVEVWGRSAGNNADTYEAYT